MTSVLSREVRAQLFAGDLPPIAGEGRCPLQAGQTIELSSRVSLKVLAVRRRRRGGWSLQYELHDRRHVPRLLRRTPGIHDEDFDAIREGFDEHGYPSEPTPDVLKDAARQSSYTSAPGPGALTDAGEAVDERTQEEFTKQAQTADHLREQRRRERFEKRATVERLAAARAEALARGIDISQHERVILDRIDRIERQLGKHRAA